MAHSTLRKIGLTRNDPRALTGERKAQLMSPDGHLPRYSSLGCYPLIYLDGEAEVLCATCASRPEEAAVAFDIYFEGPVLNCAACNGEIPSAYGDPDSEEISE